MIDRNEIPRRNWRIRRKNAFQKSLGDIERRAEPNLKGTMYGRRGANQGRRDYERLTSGQYYDQ